MGRLERYIFRQIATVFFASIGVLAGVLWLTQALRELDLVTAKGQAIWIFVFMTLLSMPLLLLIIAPVALLIAMIYTLNRLNSDSEIVVMNAAGFSPRQFIRPFAAAALMVATIIALMSLYLSPLAQKTLRYYITQVRADLIATIVRDGTFTSIEDGLVFHIRERAPGGILAGIFVSDAREPGKETVYMAENGKILETASGTFLVMQRGQIQSREQKDPSKPPEIVIVAFDQYAFDLSKFEGEQEVTFYKPRERGTAYLFAPDAEDPFYTQRPGGFRSELHDRFTAPLYPFAFMAIIMATLGHARTTRQSRGFGVVLAISLVVLVRLIGFAAISLSTKTALAVPLAYAAPLGATVLGLLSALGILRIHVPRALSNSAESLLLRVADMALPLLRRIGLLPNRRESAP